MKGGHKNNDDDDAPGDEEVDDGPDWRTGTYLDRYIPLYRALWQRRGIPQHDADRMDITLVAVELGVPASAGSDDLADVEPILGADGQRAPATAPSGIKRPAWWRGDKTAFANATRAGAQLRTHQGGMGSGGDAA